MACAPSYMTSLSLQSIFRSSNRIINLPKTDSVWNVTTQFTSRSLCEMITAPSTCFGMFDKKLSWSLLVHNSLIGTEMEEKRNKNQYSKVICNWNYVVFLLLDPHIPKSWKVNKYFMFVSSSVFFECMYVDHDVTCFSK